MRLYGVKVVTLLVPQLLPSPWLRLFSISSRRNWRRALSRVVLLLKLAYAPHLGAQLVEKSQVVKE